MKTAENAALPLSSAHGPLPVIDLNTLLPEQATVSMKLGEKPENIDLTSIGIADQIIDAILSGRIPPLEFAVKRRILTDALEVAMKDKRVKDAMMAEINKYGKGEQATALGATITLTPRTTYMYSLDTNWARINREMVEPAKLELKRQEELVKSASKSGHDLVNPDTGELRAMIVPTTTTESVTVSLKKGKK